MKFREIYNPRRVYEGWFETYFIRPFVHGYVDFSGRESLRTGLRSLLVWLVVTLGVAGILMGQVGLLGPEAGFDVMTVVGVVWGVLSVSPLAALAARTLRGASGEGGEGKVKVLGVDVMLGVSCCLFFVLGLMMMLTTLGSGVLNPNATATDEPDTVAEESPRVDEEPIFTYQDAPQAAEDEPARDTMPELTEPDAVPVEESFDPTIAEPDSLF